MHYSPSSVVEPPRRKDNACPAHAYDPKVPPRLLPHPANRPPRHRRQPCRTPARLGRHRHRRPPGRHALHRRYCRRQPAIQPAILALRISANGDGRTDRTSLRCPAPRRMPAHPAPRTGTQRRAVPPYPAFPTSAVRGHPDAGSSRSGGPGRGSPLL